MAAKRKKKGVPHKGRTPADPTVITPQEEAFCAHYTLHGNAYQAYMHAFPAAKRWKRATVDQHASRLTATSKIQARLSVLRLKVKAMAEEKFEIDAAWVLKRYATIARTVIPDVARWGMRKVKRQQYRGEKDDQGRRIYHEIEVEEPYLEFTASGDLTEEQAVQVRSAKMSQDKFGNKFLEIVHHDPMEALAQLAKFTGLAANKMLVEHTGRITHATAPAVKQIEDASDEREALKTFEAFRTSANTYAIERGEG